MSITGALKVPLGEIVDNLDTRIKRGFRGRGAGREDTMRTHILNRLSRKSSYDFVVWGKATTGFLIRDVEGDGGVHFSSSFYEGTKNVRAKR